MTRLDYEAPQPGGRWRLYLLRSTFFAVAAVGGFLLFVAVTETFFNHWEPGIWARRFLRFLLRAD